MKRKTMKKVMAGALALAMVVTSLHLPGRTKTVEAAPNSNVLRLWYDEPVSQGNPFGDAGGFNPTDEDNRWQQLSLPIGNSYMGANIFGEIGTEKLTFNHKTLWNGGPSDSRQDYNGGNIATVNYNGRTYTMSDFVKMVQDEFLKGNSQTASQMCSYIKGLSDGYGSYQAFGEIHLDFGLTGTPTEYVRDLNLQDAVANVDFTLDGTTYHREYLASYPDNVIVMKMTASKAMENVTISFPIDQPTNTSLGKDVTTKAVGQKITVAGTMRDNQMKFNGQLEVVAKDGSVTANADGTLTVSGTTEFVAFVSADTDYLNDYPDYRTGETAEQLDASVAKVVKDAKEKGYDAVKADAIADYKNIFDRVNLDLGQVASQKTTDELLKAYNANTATDEERRALEVVLFQYGRFLQIQSSRAGDLPANLQGVWNNRSGDHNYVPWGSDYHMNVNLQMNYWPTYVTNMAECAIPLIDYIDSLREPGRVTAETYFGVKSENGEENGYSAHTQNTPFGWTCPGWEFSWGWSPAAVPWILQNCYEYYEYTGDKEILENQLYPMLKEEAKLYMQILVEDEDTGRWVTAPAYSPEHGPYTAGNTYEQSLVWQLFKDTSEAADALGIDSEFSASCKEWQEKTKPIEIGDSGQIKEWYEETTLGSMGAKGHRHMSHLLGLYPGDLINVDNDEYLNAAIVSLTDRGDDATGWGMGQRLNSWARVGDGDHAYDIIKAFFRRGAYPNLWDSHAPFQIDGNFGYTAGVAELLLQSNVGYINMLPALPDVWTNGNVEGLVARGNFEVDMTWENKNLTEATILSKNGGTCTVGYSTITDAKVLNESGQEVAVNVVDGKISFETTKGATYRITEIPEKPLEAPQNISAFYVENEAIVTFDEVFGATSYKVYASTNGTDYAEVATVTDTAYKDSAYASGKTYKVASVNDKGVGAMSNAITAGQFEITNKIDDRDARINYSSDWGNWGPQDGQYLQTEKYSKTPGSTAEFYFYGQAVRVIGMKNTDCGKFELYVDDVKIGTEFNTYNGSCIRQQVLAEANGLAEGLHKVEIVVVTSKISLDAFEFDTAVEATGLEITGADSLNMNETTTLQLSASYTPSGATGAGINWSVDKETVATIDENGLLTALKPGTVVVTATDKVDSSLTATKTITITKEAAVVKYDDRDSSITYDAGWGTWDDPKHYQGTETETTTDGASFTFKFTGTGVALYCMKLEKSGNTGGAQLAVSIDGGEPVNVSTFTTVAGSEPQKKVFENLTLENGEHTVTVTVNGLGQDAIDAGVTSPKVCFDYYEVTIPGEEAECEHANTKIVGAVAPTCETAGQTGDKVCTECGEIVEVSTEIPALGHDYGEWTVKTPATCTEKGERTQTCKNDASHVNTEEIPALGHDFAEEFTVDKEATCEEAGSKSKHCSRCDAKTDVTEIEALGHEMGEWKVVKEATEEEEGLEERTCTRKGCTYSEQRAIPKLPPKPVEPGKIDKPALEEYYNECLEYYKQDSYTANSWKAYEAAMANAKAVLAKEDATEEEIKAAIQAIVAAAEQLEKAAETKPEDPNGDKKPAESDDKKDSPTTGDNLKVMPIIIVMLLAVAAITGIVFVKKKRK